MQQLTLYYDVNFRGDVLGIVKCHSLKYRNIPSPKPIRILTE